MDDAVRPMPMFPLGTVLLPGALLPLHIFEPRYRALVADCLAGDRCFGVVLIAKGSEVGGGDQRVGVGSEARIEAARTFEDGRWAMIARGTRRIEVVEWLEDAPYPAARVRAFPDEDDGPDATVLEEAAAAVARARALASELGRPLESTSDLFDDEDTGSGEAAPDSDAEAGLWRLCGAAPLGPFDRQRLLEAPGPRARVALLVELATELGDDLAALL